MAEAKTANEPETTLIAAAHGQGWILDQLLRMSRSEDVLHPGIMGMRLERGFVYGDMQRVFERVHSVRAYPRGWEAEGVRQEALAIEAESAQVPKLRTASQHRHRAALYFGRAAHMTPGTDPRRVERYQSVRRNYDQLIAHSGGRISHHELQMSDGGRIFALFHRAEGPGPHPTLLYVPGMDATKEDYPNPFLNDFTARGFNVIAMDGPGQGEALSVGTKVTADNYADAMSAVLNLFVEFPEVDANQICAFGTSMGTYWSVIGASRDTRIRALAGQMPNIGSKSVIFREAQPNFRRIYKFMAGITVDSDMDATIPVMDAALQKAGDELEIPYLLVGGDLDELTPPDHMESWISRLTCPKELWLYQDVFHPMGEVVADAYPAIADWLLDALNGALPEDLNRIVTIDPRA